MIAKQQAANDAVRKSGGDGGKGGKIWSVLKRLCTGFFLIGWFTTPCYLGHFYVFITAAIFGTLVFREVQKVKIDNRKEGCSEYII
jgi:hypothetical protein